MESLLNQQVLRIAALCCVLGLLGGCKQESTPPAQPAPEPTTVSEATETATAEPTSATPEPSPPPGSEPSAEGATGPVEPDTAAAGGEEFEDGSWAIPLQADIDQCSRTLTEWSELEARHVGQIEKLCAADNALVPQEREVRDDLSRIQNLAAEGTSVSVGKKTYAPADLQDLISRGEGVLAEADGWSAIITERAQQAERLRQEVRSGKHMLTQVRNNLAQIENRTELLLALRDMPMPGTDEQSPDQARASFREELTRSLRQDVATLSTDLAGLKEQLAGGPPELDLQPVDIRAVEQAVGAIHAEVKAVTQATAEP